MRCPVCSNHACTCGSGDWDRAVRRSFNAGERPDIEPGVDTANCPMLGEIRILNGNRCRFIERELEGDKWEVLGPAEATEGEGS